MLRKSEKGKRFGVIGGLGAIAGADLFLKLVKSTPSQYGRDHIDIVYEQHPFDDGESIGENAIGNTCFNPTSRKLYIFDMIRQFERRKVDVVILPCFISHTFIDELRSETRLPIVNLMEALRLHIDRRRPEQSDGTPYKLGILTSNFVRQKALFEQTFDPERYTLLYPASQIQQQCLMPAIYGADGIKSGNLQGASVELLYRACQDLLNQGAQLIVPGATEIAIVVDALRERGIPIVDPNQAYVQHALGNYDSVQARAVKIGIVGGVGPAATVDFMNKIIRNTDAQCDQEHVKLIIEHNPQIPDRTENLLADGADPTIALYSACKKLEANEADMIAIPCNTAHAFVERIQSYLSIPIVNMLHETVETIRQHHGLCRRVGLLATSGTIQSRVYHEAIGHDLTLMVPDADHQQHVMSAIYGPQGVKAGYTDGLCKKQLLLALEHLVSRGAEVIILGCTELPLLIEQTMVFCIAGTSVAILDPTEILARKCVALARGSTTH